jgi:geranylgeranyl diphosphate synthase type II
VNASAAIDSGDALIRDMLAEYGEATRRAVSRFLPDKEPRRYLYDLTRVYPLRGGKMMRPGILIAVTKAFGGELEDALHCAASIELLHNAMLVHDDIEDESDMRRGKPTLHRDWGVPLAINVGDMLTLLSLRPLFDNSQRLGSTLAARIVNETSRVAGESAEGQAMELGWRLDNSVDVTEADYLEMVLKKTCWLATIYPIRIGALIGTRNRVDPDRFLRFGFFLGAAFQIQDDLLNLLADSAYGKERNGDLWEGKRSLMLIHTLSRCSDTERSQIRALLATPREQKCQRLVSAVRDLLDQYDSLDYARRVAQGLAGAALHEFEHAFAGLPASRDLEFLHSLPTWVFTRSVRY